MDLVVANTTDNISILKRFGDGVEFRASTREEIMPFAMRAFEESHDQGMHVLIDDWISPTQRQHVESSRGLKQLNFSVHCDGQVIGSFTGRQGDKGIFRMGMSVILPAYQGRGFYNRILDFVLEWARTNEFWAIDSRHNPCNSRIIAAKLKKGFFIRGYEVDVQNGPMISMIFFFDERIRDLFLFRNCYKSPSEELRGRLPVFTESP